MWKLFFDQWSSSTRTLLKLKHNLFRKRRFDLSFKFSGPGSLVLTNVMCIQESHNIISIRWKLHWNWNWNLNRNSFDLKPRRDTCPFVGSWAMVGYNLKRRWIILMQIRKLHWKIPFKSCIKAWTPKCIVAKRVLF